MKRTLLQDFIQIYKKDGKENKYNYQVAIVLDTQNYKYRIMNVTSGSIWKEHAFKSYTEAEKFLHDHPHSIGEGREIELNKIY